MMDFIQNFPFFSIVMSLFFAVLSSVLKPKFGEWLAVFSIALSTFFSLSVLFYTLTTGESFTYMMGHFPAPWGNEIRGGVLEGLPRRFLILSFCFLFSAAVPEGRKISRKKKQSIIL